MDIFTFLFLPLIHLLLIISKHDFLYCRIFVIQELFMFCMIFYQGDKKFYYIFNGIIFYFYFEI